MYLSILISIKTPKLVYISIINSDIYYRMPSALNNNCIFFYFRLKKNARNLFVKKTFLMQPPLF